MADNPAEEFVQGVKKVPSRKNVWMVLGATVGMIAVLALSSMLDGRPSLTPRIPVIGAMVPIPGGA